MENKKSYALLILIIFSAFLFSILGQYWNSQYYQNDAASTSSSPPLASAMRGLHDKLYLADITSFQAGYAINNLSTTPTKKQKEIAVQAEDTILSKIASELSKGESISVSSYIDDSPIQSDTLDFMTVTEDYFDDACFIGDSRTVGISEYSGIENATFLCKTSLSIYDYNKPKITYEDKKMSIHDILAEKQFAKIYLMVGINECGIGTAESFYERYRDVVADIRSLQPEALIFLQGNLLITESKSEESEDITNENILIRNKLIASLANQKDIFYIDINDSSLCADGALVSDYTWDQVHIKAQYYPLWKDFLLQQAIIKD